MSLLHATWLENIEQSTKPENPLLFLWADKWTVAQPKIMNVVPAKHPFSLSIDELSQWLKANALMPSESMPQKAYLTLPSKHLKQKNVSRDSWTGLPIQAGESIPAQYEWWPWEIEGLALKPTQIINLSLIHI